ncbi:MAG: hypothetical protein HC849_32505, partial [Oscillatoriales cyanobacterium RU_3_3]|nr:hypothetical protein [Oscillatoriales cyanobacterium RU_3_3]
MQVQTTAILSQIDANGIEHVVSYYSRKLTETESRYSAAELECYAVVLSVKHFRIYLEGMKFELLTDCRALAWLISVNDTKSRLFRWLIALSTYDYTLRHRLGTTNQAADAISRNPVAFLEEYDQHRESIAESNELHLEKFESDGKTHVRTATETKVLVPPTLREELLKRIHDERGHPGI